MIKISHLAIDSTESLWHDQCFALHALLFLQLYSVIFMRLQNCLKIEDGTL